MRGDRPDVGILDIRRDMFTPHARGSTFLLLDFLLDLAVYPACAGIDP